MKKVIFSVLSVSLVASTMTSCGKTTKGKMDNEWNVTAKSWSSTDEDGDGSAQTIANGVVTYSNMNNGTTTSTTGTVNAYTMTIKKDGTWESNVDVTTSNKQTNGIYTTTTTSNTKSTASGTWSFVGTNKTEDFKTNERVVFNTLKDNSNTSNSSVTTDGTNSVTTTSSSSDADTYKTGENSIIYTVSESTAKKLVLTTDGMSTSSNSNTSGGNTTTNTGSQTTTSSMTLEQK